MNETVGIVRLDTRSSTPGVSGRVGTRLASQGHRVDPLSLSPAYRRLRKLRMYTFPRFMNLDSFSYVEPHKSMYIRLANAQRVTVTSGA